MGAELVLAPGAESGEISSEVDDARGLDQGRAVLALVEVHYPDARAERNGLAEVEEGGARGKAARALPEGLGVLGGEAGPEDEALRGEPNALEREVGAEADLLVLRWHELVLREAVQVAEAPERAKLRGARAPSRTSPRACPRTRSQTAPRRLAAEGLARPRLATGRAGLGHRRRWQCR
eukprot:9690407-Alexandrium_andersonii.AAC.1